MAKKHTGKAKQLPPDPEGRNDERAHLAGMCIEQFCIDTGTDLEDGVADLLANMMHWCDRNDTNFSKELRRARGNYSAEISYIACPVGRGTR